MFAWFSDFCEKRRQKRLRGLLRAQISKNLELFYVMQQLGQYRLFVLGPRTADVPSSHPAIFKYGQKLGEFNQALAAAQEFERWYSVDIDRQNPNNAKKLHDLKEAVAEKFQGLEAVIIDARSSILVAGR